MTSAVSAPLREINNKSALYLQWAMSLMWIGVFLAVVSLLVFANPSVVEGQGSVMLAHPSGG